ncbi:hypothetical protein [Oscillatoria salina]|uniref:hypothetical protein n=1 Tax=Oscillatoria salina TaxID=331517 RepID=UPI0013BB5B41|nr:hypothetical protein [Oscillatoria salina]MBZ8181676.1 hypothetical protein [Oscillatoria salina IIICB1]NET90679.1 hypothetical protein [Kamptonema sp. SIO1D9]
MLVHWNKLFNKTGFWLATEITLNLLGLDSLADYSEFIFNKDLELERKNNRIVKVSHPAAFFCELIDEECPLPKGSLQNSDLNLPSGDRNYRNSCNLTFKHKCTQLKNPCVKVWCLSDI